MTRTLPLLASLLLSLDLVAAQSLAGKTKEVHPKLKTYTCTKKKGCKAQDSYIVLDSELHPTYQKDNPSLNCGVWGAPPNATVCPDAKTCNKNCVIDGISDYSAYGVTTKGSALTLDMLRDSDLSRLSPRVYLLDSDKHKYDLLKLTGNEFAFDVDVSKLPCGLNGALYLSEMHKYGGKSSLNKAGAELGAGYCDAQCFTFPFLEGVGNIEGKGACCNEMDIWEANSRSTAFVPHPCNISGVYPGSPAESAFEGVCDKWGCGFNPYGTGNPDFYGRQPEADVDTKRPFTVVTSFPADKNGILKEIRRTYVQDGLIIGNPTVKTVGRDNTRSWIDDGFCEENPGGTRRFTELGGTAEMGRALSRGMVLAFSIWWDEGGFMDWLDGAASGSGPCGPTEGSPANIRLVQPDTQVTFSEIKWGEIGSTYKGR